MSVGLRGEVEQNWPRGVVHAVQGLQNHGPVPSITLDQVGGGCRHQSGRHRQTGRKNAGAKPVRFTANHYHYTLD